MIHLDNVSLLIQGFAVRQNNFSHVTVLGQQTPISEMGHFEKSARFG